MNLATVECNNYLNDVIGKVQDVLDMHSNFRFKLKVSKLKIKLNKKFEDYSREKSKGEQATSRLDRVPKEVMEEFVKLVNVDILRRNL